MHKAADGADLSENHGDSFGTIVSDLVVLVEHVQASINLMEAAIARETSGSDHEPADIVVLDDVTPRYLSATLALNACHASLGEALQFLIDARRSGGRSTGLMAH
jgi:hypothetical protein